jgi:hypothetical protein
LFESSLVSLLPTAATFTFMLRLIAKQLDELLQFRGTTLFHLKRSKQYHYYFSWQSNINCDCATVYFPTQIAQAYKPHLKETINF